MTRLRHIATIAAASALLTLGFIVPAAPARADDHNYQLPNHLPPLPVVGDVFRLGAV
ncbi:MULTISPECIES: hypothetical protein [unclassified Streptomyces]|uniref:hypothetical protein n=1 Tax=unclassified Streptomyces TaxID=2593676 RepID=UPI00037F9391|nr:MULTISPECIES: hypothetical protein [unclassified Streptomyces]MYT32404.1 hypothetical protein [Streptomyces sp. SID8354]